MRSCGRLLDHRLVLVASMCAAGCAPPAWRAGFDSPDPASRIFAIEDAVRAGDTSAVPRIVEELDSDDPAVRLMAITALERLTEVPPERHGFRYYDPPLERREAIRWWVEYLRGEPTPLTPEASGVELNG